MKLSLIDRRALVVTALARPSRALLDRPEPEIGHQLFEEFDIEAWSFLHEDNLDALKEAGLIDGAIAELGREIRARWLTLTDGRRWTAEEIRRSSEWDTLFARCEEATRILDYTQR
jgi:hypothetical protein